MTLSTKPLGGMRQRYPDEFRVERYVTDILRSCGLKAGFEEYDGPVLEPLELFAAKSGSELIDRQSYCFRDRGERNLIMRPEMTPTLARMVAACGELHLPVRWFSTPLCYRYERPQRGRVREFLQYNCDILGSDHIAAELEVILVLEGIMKALGVPSSLYRIGWSSRRFMADALTGLGAPADSVPAIFSAIDKREKMPAEKWLGLMLDTCGDNRALADRVVRLADASSLNEEWLEELMNGCPSYIQAVEFQDLLRLVRVESAVFTPAVVRGLDYYTGIVFELMDTGGENRRALCGGGRYDNLAGLFGSKRISGVGFGMGVLTLSLFLETYGLIPREVLNAPRARLYIAVLSGEHLAEAASVACFFRSAGLDVMMDVSGRKLGRQFAEAERCGIPHILVVGGEEAASGRYSIKNLSDGTLFSGTAEELLRSMGSRLVPTFLPGDANGG
jgi:histidyl-tRNA synthetase